MGRASTTQVRSDEEREADRKRALALDLVQGMFAAARKAADYRLRPDAPTMREHLERSLTLFDEAQRLSAAVAAGTSTNDNGEANGSA